MTEPTASVKYKIREGTLGQGEKGHAIAIVFEDPVSKATWEQNIAYFPEKYRSVAEICARALDREHEQQRELADAVKEVG